ncbi:MAG: hydrogen peroxide-dependent heme synthase [Planctomycetaceae bacterium]
MQRPTSQALPDPTRLMTTGWHCLHIYYQVDRQALASLGADQRHQGATEVIAALNAEGEAAPARIQSFAVSGHRADFGIVMFDPDPLKIDAVHQAVGASQIGSVLKPTYSFVSITEVSEYVPTLEQYGERLRHEGTSPDDPAYQAKLKAYEQRLPAMNKQRLYPETPDWPMLCFYPMNKMRHPHANWFRMPFSERSKLMAEHATSGIKFAGKISQVITASTGYDDWEWGVTLWSRTPEYIKDIVYTMRFDEASAGYAEFGPFYVGYIQPAEQSLRHLRIID